MKKSVGFTPQVRSKNNSIDDFKKGLPKMPFRSIVRLGSITALPDDVSSGGNRIEINTVQAVKVSSNKLLMKQAFDRAGSKTAPWCQHHELGNPTATGLLVTGKDEIPFPIVAKAKFGSKGKGNTLINNLEEYNAWRTGKTMANYIFEKFMNYALEYRLHISANGSFYACRKALKSDCPADQKWRHHDDTCVWFMELTPEGRESENFKKPNSWTNIVEDCVAALHEIGADVLAFDVKVQGNATKKGKAREFQEFILLESNSAPAFGDVTTEKYLEEIPKLLRAKKG